MIRSCLEFPSVPERERKVERTGWTAAAAPFVCSLAFPMGRRMPRPSIQAQAARGFRQLPIFPTVSLALQRGKRLLLSGMNRLKRPTQLARSIPPHFTGN